MKIFILFFCFSLFSFAQSPAIKLNLVANGFGQVVDIVTAGDNRLFIVDGTQIKIISNNQVLATPFLHIADRATWIMATAFHPNYAENVFFMLNTKH